MSHAGAVWIPGNHFEATKLEALVREFCEHEELEFQLYVRSKPKATFVLAPLDDRHDLEMTVDLLDDTAAGIAKELGVTTCALYAFFGSGDWLQITAFAPDGSERWSEASNDGGLVGPYTKMLSEVAPGVEEDFLALGVKPAFDLAFVDGWSAVRSFVVQGNQEPAPRRPIVIPEFSLEQVDDVLAQLRALEVQAEAKPKPKKKPVTKAKKKEPAVKAKPKKKSSRRR